MEKFKDWADADQVPEDAVDRDRMLTNVMLYWLTRTGGSSAQFYYEIAEFLPVNVTTGRYQPDRGSVRGRGVPARTVRSRCAGSSSATSRPWCTGREFDRGGNFAALEEPDLYIEDVRAFRRTLARPRPAVSRRTGPAGTGLGETSGRSAAG